MAAFFSPQPAGSALAFYLTLVSCQALWRQGVASGAGPGPFRKDNVLDRLLTGWLAAELAQAAYLASEISIGRSGKRNCRVVPVNAGADLVSQ